MENIKINCHSSIKITDSKGRNMYFDPFKIGEKIGDADFVFITHEHYDHFETESINNISNNKTKLVMPLVMEDKIKETKISKDNVILVEPKNEYLVDGIEIEVVPSYNENKQFHPKENKWVGYIISVDGEKYYIAGDTDITEENKAVKTDIALVPVGGTYTMTASEAAELINIIKPKIAIPTHYGEIVGKKTDGEEFKKLVNPEIKCEILIK